MTREQNKTVLMVTCGALLAAMLAFLIGFERRTASGGDDGRTARVRAEWGEHNKEALMSLSAVRTLSVQEQRRFNRAGDDPEGMRQALIEIHEERLTNASLDLQDAQQRKAQMQASGGYKVYADRPQTRDLVQLINEDEWTATSQIALYARALSRIRAWNPVSYKSYAAATRPVGVRVPVEDAGRVSEKPRKPDSRVPLNPEPVLVGQRRVPAVQEAASTGEADLAKAAPKPSLTVYANDEPANAGGGGADIGGRERAEEEIGQTLRRWSGAMLLNDPKAEAAEYAPYMDRYFLRKNVDKAFVQADKAAYLRRGNVTAGFTLQGVTIENETDDAADVRLVKDVTWQRRTKGEMHQLIRSRLHLARFGDGWKITGEQDFR